MAINVRVAQLADSLIKQGYIPEEAWRYSKDYLAESRMNRGTFMAMLAVQKKKEVYTSSLQAIKSGTLRPGRKEQRTIKIGTPSFSYSIVTNLPVAFITPILTETFIRWMQFGQGTSSLGGKRLKNPSGRYAASLRTTQESDNSFTLYSDSPYADTLEKGRHPYNLVWGNTNFHGKNTKLIPIGNNSLIKMGKTPLTSIAIWATEGGRSMYSSAKVSGQANRIAKQVYANRYNGADAAWVSKDSVWKIDSKHPMRIYSPAFHLYEMMSRKVKLAEKGL